MGILAAGLQGPPTPSFHSQTLPNNTKQPGQPAHLSNAHIRGWPNVSLVSLRLHSKIVNWEVQDFLRDSHSIVGDHRPIHRTISGQVPKIPRRRFKTKNVPQADLSKSVQRQLEAQNKFFKHTTY